MSNKIIFFLYFSITFSYNFYNSITLIKNKKYKIKKKIYEISKNKFKN